jgi:hypothetical protein
VNIEAALNGFWNSATGKIDGTIPLPHAEDERWLRENCAPHLRACARQIWHWARLNNPNFHRGNREQPKRVANTVEQIKIFTAHDFQRMEKMCVPQGFLTLVKNGGLVECEQDRKIEDAVARNCLFILLHHLPESGKTTSACNCLSRRSIGKYVQASWVLSFSKDFSDDRDALRAYEETAFLVIDDLGRGFETGKHRDRFDDLLCTRFDNERPTLITTNKPAGDFIVDYGPRVERRATDINRSALIECALRSNQ